MSVRVSSPRLPAATQASALSLATPRERAREMGRTLINCTPQGGKKLIAARVGRHPERFSREIAGVEKLGADTLAAALDYLRANGLHEVAEGLHELLDGAYKRHVVDIRRVIVTLELGKGRA